MSKLCIYSSAYLFLFNLTARMGVTKLSSHMVDLFFVFTMWSLLGEREGSSPRWEKIGRNNLNVSM
jgi:hypothetical protein